MKIVQIIPSLRYSGGAERFVIDLTIALKKLGHEVVIISLYSADNRPFFQEDIDNNSIDVIYLNKTIGFDMNNSIVLRRTIKRINPNIVHSHVNSHISMFFSGLWRNKSTIKFYHTIHSVPNQECKKILPFYFMKYLYRRKIVTPIAITDVLSTMTKEYYHLKYYPVAIYNGVFIEKFQNSVDIKERGISFVSVANFSKNKNQISIVKAALHLINHGVNVDVTFLGEGTEFESVKNFASKTIQPNAFKFEGRVQNVADYLKNSKCLVIPSYYEGNPLSILEAMASGLAVIATNNGGAKDIIEEGINGFLVSPEDSFSLISRMKQIALDKQLLEFISKNNLRKVLEYDMSNVAVKYLDLYSLGNLYVNEKKE